jgi:hypothetical protein
MDAVAREWKRLHAERRGHHAQAHPERFQPLFFRPLPMVIGFTMTG